MLPAAWEDSPGKLVPTFGQYPPRIRSIIDPGVMQGYTRVVVEFERILKDRGYRLTNQRRVIVRGLEGDRHLSAEEIYDRLKGEHP